MALDFGKYFKPSATICYDVPDQTVPTEKIDVPINLDLNLPDGSGFKDGVLAFGKQVGVDITNFGQNVKNSLNSVGGGGNFKLNFGGGDFSNVSNALNNLSFPTTVCLNVGSGVTLRDVLDQLLNAIRNLNIPNINLDVPKLGDVAVGAISSLVPAIDFKELLPCSLPLSKILSDLAERCANMLINELHGLDPSELLRQIFDRLAELCGLLQFSKMRNLIDQFQALQADVIRSIIDKLVSPLDKLAKLYDMACDAIAAGATDILDSISNLGKAVSFEALMAQIQAMNPRDAIAALSAELRRMAQLKNFEGMRQILDAINIVKSQFAAITDAGNSLLELPENFLDTLQDKINEALDLENYDAIANLLNSYDSLENATLNALQNLDPATLLAQGQNLLSDAISKLNMGKYNRILDIMAAKICAEGTDLLPNVSVPHVNPSVLPSFLL